MMLENLARGELLDGLHAYLRAARLARGWTLREAQEHSGIDNAHISQIERGVITDPGWRIVVALELAYGVTPYQYAGAEAGKSWLDDLADAGANAAKKKEENK